MKLFLFTLTVTMMLSGFSQEAKQSSMTASELQRYLGIQAWRLKLPENYNTPRIQLIKIVNGKETILIENQFIISKSRECLVTLKHQGKTYDCFYESQTKQGSNQGNFFSISEIKPKGYNLSSHDCRPVIKKDSIVLFSQKFYKMKSPSDHMSEKKLLCKLILKIVPGEK